MSQDAATRVILVRHGQTEWNVDARIQGHLDVPLNDHGRWQAARLAQALADEPLAAIYSSDLQRARATAQVVAQRLSLPVHDEVGLRERCFGEFEGTTFHEVERDFPLASQRWRRRDPDFAPPGGETLADFFARSVATAERLARVHAGSTIALFTHGGVLDCLYRAATGQALEAPRSWSLGNASVNRLLHGGSGFVLVGWNDDTHLEVDLGPG